MFIKFPYRVMRTACALAALLISFALSVRNSEAVGAAAPAVEARQDRVVALNDADTMDAEFIVGPAGKIALVFKFADGKMETLLGTVKPDVLKREVMKDGKKALESVPMPDGLIEFKGAKLNFHYHSRPNLARYAEAQ